MESPNSGIIHLTNGVHFLLKRHENGVVEKELSVKFKQRAQENTPPPAEKFYNHPVRQGELLNLSTLKNRI